VRPTKAGLVDIVREFLTVHPLLRRLFEAQRRHQLRFEDVQALAGDTEASPLFRLKERCHALFRAGELRGDALFDLAVGSLFHETMKLRENLYQLEVYAPKVDAARAHAEPGSEALFEEFGRILEASLARLVEAAAECEALLEQTRRQFRALLATHRENGLVVRYLIENQALAEEVLAEPLDGFFTAVHRDPARAWALASRSYLESGYFEEARRSLDAALARDAKRADLRRLAAYADGMSAYQRGRYGDALEHLERWARDGVPAEEERFRALAHTAVEKLPPLVEDTERAALGERAQTLARALARGADPGPSI
jgi:tetratricopeptide (TPR) repeat protein